MQCRAPLRCAVDAHVAIHGSDPLAHGNQAKRAWRATVIGGKSPAIVNDVDGQAGMPAIDPDIDPGCVGMLGNVIQSFLHHSVDRR